MPNLHSLLTTIERLQPAHQQRITAAISAHYPQLHPATQGLRPFIHTLQQQPDWDEQIVAADLLEVLRTTPIPRKTCRRCEG
jgi:hypothetical protein